jgi:hypothetical protein
VRWYVTNPLMLANAQLKLERYLHSQDNKIEEWDVTGTSYKVVDVIQRYPYKQYSQWFRLVITKNGITKATEFVPAIDSDDKTYEALVKLVNQFVKGRSATIAFVYKLKYGGELCDVCFNPTLLKASDPFCPVCLGTGYKGGFNEPVKTKVIIVSAPQRAVVRKVYIDTPSNWVIRAPVEIPLSVNDVVYLPHGQAWLTVSHVVEQRYGAVPVAQIASLTQEDEDSVYARYLTVPDYDPDEKDISPKIVPRMPDEE